MRNDLKITNEIWNEKLNLPEAKRGAFISQECAKVIVKLTKLLRIKQGDNIKVNFDCVDMNNFKYFGFTTKTDCWKVANFKLKGKNTHSSYLRMVFLPMVFETMTICV